MQRYFTFTAIVIAVLLSLLIFIPLCQSEDLTLELSVEPAKGIEPLLVKIRISAYSSRKIKAVQVDLNGDGSYDLDEKPGSRIYEKSLTEIYSFPDFSVGDEFESSGFPVTIYARVKGERKSKEGFQTILVLPKKEFDFYLVASTCSGVPPLTVDFLLYIKDCPECNLSWDCDGDGVFEFSAKATNHICEFTKPGLYPSAVSVKDGMGNFAVSKYFFCGKKVSSKISRYIEVIFKNDVSSAALFFSQNMRIADVFTYDSTEYVALLGNPGTLIVKNREVIDWFDFDLINWFASPRFAKFYFKDRRVHLYFSSSGGIFKWAEDMGYPEKISERPFIFLYPLEVSGLPSPLTYIVAVDHINRLLVVCKGGWNSCIEISDPQIGFYSSVKPFYNAGNFYLLLVNREDPPVYVELIKILLDGKFPGVQTEFVVTTEDFPELYSVYDFDYVGGKLALLPSPLSSFFYVVDIGDRKLRKIERDNLKLAFLSISFINDDEIFLGANEFPCEVRGELSSCNAVTFSISQGRFNYIDGEGEVVSSYSSGGKVYSSTTRSLEIFSYYQGKKDIFRLMNDLRDFFFDGRRLYIAGNGGYSVFSKGITFIKYFSVSDGVPTAIYSADDFVFVGVSDNLETSPALEGKVIVSYDSGREWKSIVVSDENLSSSQVNCISALKYGDGMLTFVCANSKLLVFYISLDHQGDILVRKEREIDADQHIIGVWPTSKHIYAISSGKLYVFTLDGNKVSEYETVRQFYQIDVDLERNLLFSAEGQDHAFRIWDISGNFPIEITRISLDYGVHNDIAVGISHLGSSLFVASSYAGLMEFDIGNPSKPFIIRKSHFDEVYFSLGKCFSSYEFVVCLGSGILFFIK